MVAGAGQKTSRMRYIYIYFKFDLELFWLECHKSHAPWRNANCLRSHRTQPFFDGFPCKSIFHLNLHFNEWHTRVTWSNDFLLIRADNNNNNLNEQKNRFLCQWIILLSGEKGGNCWVGWKCFSVYSSNLFWLVFIHGMCSITRHSYHTQESNKEQWKINDTKRCQQIK